MKKFTILCLCFITLSFSVQASDKFFSVLYDVPILIGLEVLPELSYSYDKGNGQIAHAAAFAEVNPIRVYKAYESSLLQFGWRKLGKNSYYREGELLVISHEALDQAWLFHFTLRPAVEKQQ